MGPSGWLDGIKVAVTVCDRDGIILDMNAGAAAAFAKDGGRRLVGRDLMACHPQKAREKLRALLETETVNAYTIEKKGVRKLIYQAPWYENGVYAGLVEFSLPIPSGEMPHFVRR